MTRIRSKGRVIPQVQVEHGSGLAVDWMALGKCSELDPAIFFPHDGVGVEAAKRICMECPVKAECLEYALANRIAHGVWGGTSERQRQRILSQRRLSRRDPVHV